MNQYIHINTIKDKVKFIHLNLDIQNIHLKIMIKIHLNRLEKILINRLELDHLQFNNSIIFQKIKIYLIKKINN